jgi:nitrogen-specific signal transduction histidine kinase/ActR/RegA family two-component response regulator
MNGVIAFGIDVTERVRAEQERHLLELNLRQAQKMQSLGTLAGGIAHDFNNILLAISGNTRLAMQDLDSDHPVQVSLSEVAKASARATGVVNQILFFSRREELPQSPINLRTVVEESLELIRATLGAQMDIQARLDSTEALVLGDPAQLHQVLLNLATNAAHAMEEGGGRLSIELDQVQVDELIAQQTAELRPGLYQRLTVRDTGVGMLPQVVERIFDPFFTTKPRGQGTGLGLSVVHGIVKSHGGAIAVHTAPGKGSSFLVYLPAIPTDVPDAQLMPASSERGRGQRILYVDDEEPLVYLMVRVLDRLGYKVSGFVDVRAALDTFKADPMAYDAVVTDLSMPGMPGTDFAREILEIRPELPVVMTSGFVRNEDREHARKIGVRELLLKPSTVDGLGEVLHRLLVSETVLGSD